jgi:outer membrane biosynthesis protein TonB
MKELSTAELQEFRDRCLEASTYGFEIGLADLYLETLVSEVGEKDVPAGVSSGSAAHLHLLASAALDQRASGGKPKAKEAPKPAPVKAAEPAKVEEPKVEAVKAEEPAKTEEPAKEVPKAEEPAKTEDPKDDKKTSKKK